MDQTLMAAPERVRIHLSARATGPGARAAAKASGATRSTTHDGWRDELAKATSEVFEIMVGTSLGNATEESPPFVADFAAMVGIAGSLCGLVALHTTSDCAREMAAKMLGSDEVGAGEDVQDAFGELCNMIAGSFKARIAGLADGCALSVPTVIIGRDFALYSLANGEHYEVTFSFEGKPFSVTLDLHG
jgi:chemotaxis protein CheX